MAQTITDEQLTQRVALAGPVLEAISFAEGHIAKLREEMRGQAARLPGITDAAERLSMGQVLGHLGYQRKVLLARAAFLRDEQARVSEGGNSAVQPVTTSAELTSPRPIMPLDDGLMPP